MRRAVPSLIVLSLLASGVALTSGPAGAAKRKCPRGTKLVDKRCKRARRKPTVRSTTISPARVTVSFGPRRSSVSITPDLTGKTARIDVRLACFTPNQNIASDQTTPPAGDTKPLTSTNVGVAQTFSGSFQDKGVGIDITYSITGKWTEQAKFVGSFTGQLTEDTSLGPDVCTFSEKQLTLVPG